MSRPIFESMTKVIVGRHIVRVWREELHLDAACDPLRNDIDLTANGLRDDGRTKSVPLQIIVEEFALLPRVSAVEVLDSNGNGVLKYNNWP